MTLTGPDRWAGVVTVMVVSSTTANAVPAVPLKVTPVASVKLVPVIVTIVPPTSGPLAGVRLVIVAGAVIWLDPTVAMATSRMSGTGVDRAAGLVEASGVARMASLPLRRDNGPRGVSGSTVIFIATSVNLPAVVSLLLTRMPTARDRIGSIAGTRPLVTGMSSVALSPLSIVRIGLTGLSNALESTANPPGSVAPIPNNAKPDRFPARREPTVVLTFKMSTPSPRPILASAVIAMPLMAVLSAVSTETSTWLNKPTRLVVIVVIVAGVRISVFVGWPLRPMIAPRSTVIMPVERLRARPG